MNLMMGITEIHENLWLLQYSLLVSVPGFPFQYGYGAARAQ